MGHGPSSNWKDDKSTGYKAKLGLWMFLVYTIIYGSFIVVNLLNPQLMLKDVGKLNLAVVYGLGLIILALILAFVYNYLCSKAELEYNSEDEGSKSK